MIKLNRQYQGAKLAPHKPLLLLLAIGSWQQKKIAELACHQRRAWVAFGEVRGRVSNAKPVLSIYSTSK